MPVFPLFVELNGKKCVVIGGGEIAARKIEILLEFNACVEVIAPEICSRILQLSNEFECVIKKQKFDDKLLEDAFLVIAATSDSVVNEEVYNVAMQKKILVNVVDDIGKCTFIFPSIVKRDDLVIGISTSGKYPALSKKIREEIEKKLPEDFGKLLKELSEYRESIKINVKDFEKRKKLLTQKLNELIKEVKLL